MMATIKIDRLEIKIRGYPEQTAHRIMNGLDRKLRARLTGMRVPSADSCHTQIDLIRTNAVRMAESDEDGRIQDAVADRVVDAIVPYIKKSRRI
jgi:hypothetical protein